MIRVMVVDDSPLARKIVGEILERDPEILVAATAASGELALQKLQSVKPDVITIDLEMPGMGGLEAIRRIMAIAPTPVIVLSAFAQRGAERTLQALELGAVDFIAKPEPSRAGRISELAEELTAMVKQAGLSRPRVPEAGLLAQCASEPDPTRGPARRFEVLVVGASTGGPVALKEVLGELPERFPLGVLVVQHMPPFFTAAFAKRLDSLCRVSVSEATGGEAVLPGRVYIAPGDRHMSVEGKGHQARVRLSLAQPVSGHRPSIDVLARSVAAAYGSRGLGLILTGMGRDGARGMAELRERGGYVIAQDQASSVIFGMNRAVIEGGHAHEVLPLGRIAERLGQIAHSAQP